MQFRFKALRVFHLLKWRRLLVGFLISMQFRLLLCFFLWVWILISPIEELLVFLKWISTALLVISLNLILIHRALYIFVKLLIWQRSLYHILICLELFQLASFSFTLCDILAQTFIRRILLDKHVTPFCILSWAILLMLYNSIYLLIILLDNCFINIFGLLWLESADLWLSSGLLKSHHFLGLFHLTTSTLRRLRSNRRIGLLSLSSYHHLMKINWVFGIFFLVTHFLKWVVRGRILRANKVSCKVSLFFSHLILSNWFAIATLYSLKVLLNLLCRLTWQRKLRN